MNTNKTDILQIAIHSAERFPDESDKSGFYSNQTLYTILSDPRDQNQTHNFTPSWLPADQIMVEVYVSSPVDDDQASPILWRGDHAITKIFQNVRNYELRTSFLLRVLRMACLELGERAPWSVLTDSGVPYTLSILGVEYIFQKPDSDSTDTMCIPFPISDEDRTNSPPIKPTREDVTTRQTTINLHLEFKVLKFQFPENALTPVSMPPPSQTPTSPLVIPMDQSSPKSEIPNPPEFTLFKPTGLILERPPSLAEIPKGTIRPLPGHHFVQVHQDVPKIDPLKIKVEKVDPEELQIINHPAKKSKKKKPSKQLVRDVITAIKELQAGQSSLPKAPLPQNQFAAFTEDVVQRLPIDWSRSGDVQQQRDDGFPLQGLTAILLHAGLLLRHALILLAVQVCAGN
jgi:hypothetical protein